jgi:hypothetical protein
MAAQPAGAPPKFHSSIDLSPEHGMLRHHDHVMIPLSHALS